MTRLIDLTGKTFGALTVTGRGERIYSSTNAMWLCKCECGATTNVFSRSLTKGVTTSCGQGNCRYKISPLQKRFDRHTIPEPNSGCLLWLGAISEHGYGQLRDGGKNRVATHVALELAGRPLPEGKFALHRCDNPYCVNADHLFAGTQQENIDDMIAKGRADHSGLALGRKKRAA